MKKSPIKRKGVLLEAVNLGWGGAKANLAPGLVLWVGGGILVLGYYLVPPLRDCFDFIGILKEEYSPWFAIVSTATFGALVPFFFQKAFLSRERRQAFKQVPWLVLFWGVHGWQVDLLYRLQTHWFGSGLDFATLVRKTSVDQFIWSPFLAVPQVLLAYLFVENECSVAKTKAALRRKGYFQRAIPLMIANWAVWIPAVTLVYLLPPSLQLPLQNLILSMWCLILIFFAKHGEQAPVPV